MHLLDRLRHPFAVLHTDAGRTWEIVELEEKN
jgi:hypothetical protein